MIDDRLVTLNYKGVDIRYYKGSSYAYIDNRPDLGARTIFVSVLAAKRYITKRLKI